MNDKLLTKLCTISAILGIILLILISDKISSPSSVIASITTKDVGKSIKINGIVSKATNKDSVSFLEVKDSTDKIGVVLFKPVNITIKKGSFVEVEGKVSIYEDSPQIYAETVKLL